MSFDVDQARHFLAPLMGKAAVFLVPDRRTNFTLGRLLLRSASASVGHCWVLDTDAFYASNSVSLARGASQPELKDTRLHIPEVDASSEDVVLAVLDAAEGHTSIVDDLNSLYHILSSEDPASAGRKLTFLMSALSFLAHTNRTAVLITIYERERPVFARRARLFAGLGDVSVTVRLDGDAMVMRCDRGSAWTGGTLRILRALEGDQL